MWQVISVLCVAAAVVCFLLWRREIQSAKVENEAAQKAHLETTSRLENELRGQERARRELEEVLTSLQDAVVMVDADARVRFLNRAALAMFEVRVENVLGAPLLEAFPSFALEASVRTAIQEEGSSARELTLHTPHLREVLLRVSPVRRASQVAGAVIIVQDLTELRRLERVRRDFVANASHELRTPVANIRAMVETLSAEPGDAGLAARFYPQIIGEAERLSRLISDLLDLARLEKQSEEFPPASNVVDLVPMIYEVINQCKYKALDRHIEIESRLAPGYERDVFVKGDSAALEQVVFNLLDNALGYTSAGGRVTVGLYPNGEANEKRVKLFVEDTGIGIPPSDLPRIFERFYRVDKARSRSQGGTGLGLAIVKHIVEQHHGQIDVTSEEGQGTTFTVTLPEA